MKNPFIPSRYFEFDLAQVNFNSADKPYTSFEVGPYNLTLSNNLIRFNNETQKGNFRIKLETQDKTPKTYILYDRARKAEYNISATDLIKTLLTENYTEIEINQNRKTLHLGNK